MLGQRLFFDPRLSGNGSISCASCHDPAQGFGKHQDNPDHAAGLSEAYTGARHFRNAPTLINTHYKAGFADVGWGWDGHMGARLEDVVRDQITNSLIMNMDMRLMTERMKQDPVYVAMCDAAFAGECSTDKTLKALSSLLITLNSSDAPFDTAEHSPAAEAGRALFEGKAGCIGCHNGPYLTDGQPHNTGVAENLEIFRDPLRHIALRAAMTNHGVPKAEIWRRDIGYFLVSKDYADVGKFITPTLRELKYTAPYMHNGLFATLEEVVAFYNAGGGHDDPLARELSPLGLSEGEQKHLIRFLESLSSRSPVRLEPLDPPRQYPAIPNWLEVHN